MRAGTRRLLRIGVLGVVVAAIGFAIFGRGQGPQKKGSAGRRGDTTAPVSVVAAAAQLADVPVYLDGVGTTRALNMVTVRPLVDGTLISVNFREGQDVKKDGVHAQIDPTT